MGFDAQAFQSASLKHREQEVPVPALAHFFGDEKPVWKVRGLTAAELGRAREAQDRSKTMAQALEAIASGSPQAEQIRNALGLSDDVPAEVARRIAILVAGSVAPECDHETAVKLSESFPTVFYELTNVITNLTGEGSEMGKRGGSGKTKTPETA
jgi:hypothetical protein